MIWNTSGYECAETIRQLEGTVDVYLDDFKYPPAAVSDAAARCSYAPDYFEVARGALNRMLISAGEPRFDDDGRLVGGVVVRHLLLPGRLEDSKRVMRFLWQRYGTRVLYSLMSQYTPVGTFPDMPELDHTVEPGAYEELLDYLDAMGLEDYFWQDGDAAAELHTAIRRDGRAGTAAVAEVTDTAEGSKAAAVRARQVSGPACISVRLRQSRLGISWHCSSGL